MLKFSLQQAHHMIQMGERKNAHTTVVERSLKAH
jgi:hypothetical protein